MKHLSPSSFIFIHLLSTYPSPNCDGGNYVWHRLPLRHRSLTMRRINDWLPCHHTYAPQSGRTTEHDQPHSQWGHSCRGRRCLWLQHQGSIFSNCPAPSANHAMQIVGVNVEERYWIIPNSCGAEWGGLYKTRDRKCYAWPVTKELKVFGKICACDTETILS